MIKKISLIVGIFLAILLLYAGYLWFFNFRQNYDPASVEEKAFVKQSVEREFQESWQESRACVLYEVFDIKKFPEQQGFSARIIYSCGDNKSKAKVWVSVSGENVTGIP